MLNENLNRKFAFIIVKKSLHIIPRLEYYGRPDVALIARALNIISEKTYLLISNNPHDRSAETSLAKRNITGGTCTLVEGKFYLEDSQSNLPPPSKNQFKSAANSGFATWHTLNLPDYDLGHPSD